MEMCIAIIMGLVSDIKLLKFGGKSVSLLLPVASGACSSSVVLE